jgi:hypothetical protein
MKTDEMARRMFNLAIVRLSCGSAHSYTTSTWGEKLADKESRSGTRVQSEVFNVGTVIDGDEQVGDSAPIRVGSLAGAGVGSCAAG